MATGALSSLDMSLLIVDSSKVHFDLPLGINSCLHFLLNERQLKFEPSMVPNGRMVRKHGGLLVHFSVASNY